MDNITEKLEELDSKSKEFSSLLDSIESTDDKKKLLWREIYGNAITDRMNAYMLFTGIYTTMGNSTTDYISVSPALVNISMAVCSASAIINLSFSDQVQSI